MKWLTFVNKLSNKSTRFLGIMVNLLILRLIHFKILFQGQLYKLEELSVPMNKLNLETEWLSKKNISVSILQIGGMNLFSWISSLKRLKKTSQNVWIKPKKFCIKKNTFFLIKHLENFARIYNFKSLNIRFKNQF